MSVQMWARVCVCVLEGAYRYVCVYPCKFVRVCRNEQVWVGVSMCV